MGSVLVLTSAAALSDDIGAAAVSALEGAGAKPGAAHRLASNALEIPFSGADTLDAVREAFASVSIDVNALPIAGRRKTVLISDMDSTIIPVECIDEIAAHAGIGPQVAEITERAMQGELDFEAAIRERVGLLTGFEEAALQSVYDSRVSLNPGAAEMVGAMNAAGALTALISGGFDFFTERVAAAAGFQRNQANRLIVSGGRLTGEVAAPILGREAKLEALTALCAEKSVSLKAALALGDGANDLGMIEAAGLGVAWKAKPAVAAAADARLDHSDLTAVLRLQGLADEGFAPGA